MKININNLTLVCKEQRLICDNCLFKGTVKCAYGWSMLNKLCREFDIIFVKYSSSDLFNL